MREVVMNRRYFLKSSLAGAIAACCPAAHLLAVTRVSGGIEAVTGSGSPITLEPSALQALKDSLRGALLLPGEPGYDQARRVLNESIDKHPAFVVQPSGVSDIRTAVTFASERDLLLAVKCGGHSYSGKSTCDRGMQIDLSRFRGVRVDPSSRTADVAGGSLLGELDHEAMAFGLVTTAGTVSHTGIAGLTLGGGFGRVARRFGLALDNVKAVDIVTADGRLLHASATENPDLLWGVRGGGGNFGIVTSFEFALHPMSRQVIGGDLVFPFARARELLEFYADYSQEAPDDLYMDAVMNAPAGGKDGVFLFHVCYTGPAAQAETVLAPVRKLGTPVAGKIGAVDYVALQRSRDRTDPRNEGQYLKSGFINGFGPGLVDAIVAGFEPHPERGTAMFFQHSGGAIGRVAADATAFPHRRSSHNMFAAVSWPLAGDPAPHVAYVKGYWANLERFTDGYYTNEVGDEAQRFVDENYQGNLARLQALKNKYDPGNLFRLNANVKPTA
jgi:FAD/FMN-containing dehydrogenase